MALGTNYSRNPTLRMDWITHIRIMSSLLKKDQPEIKRSTKTKSIFVIFKQLDVECKIQGLKR